MHNSILLLQKWEREETFLKKTFMPPFSKAEMLIPVMWFCSFQRPSASPKTNTPYPSHLHPSHPLSHPQNPQKKKVCLSSPTKKRDWGWSEVGEGSPQKKSLYNSGLPQRSDSIKIYASDSELMISYLLR